MKKVVLFLLTLCLCTALLAGCGSTQSTTEPSSSAPASTEAAPAPASTEAAPAPASTEAAPAPSSTEVAPASTEAAPAATEAAAPAATAAVTPGIVFEDKGNYTVMAKDVIDETMAFPIETSGKFAVKVYALDAAGTKLGDLKVTGGLIDYAAFKDKAAKIVVEGGNSGGKYEYAVPAAGAAVAVTPGIVFEDKGNYTVMAKDVIDETMAFPIETSGKFAVKVYALDAAGSKLGDLKVTGGLIDYAVLKDKAAKIVVEGGNSGGTYEYTVPAAK